MNNFRQLTIICLVALAFAACKDDATDTGSSIFPSTDNIVIATDTFHLKSSNVSVDYIYSKPDSFLLGEFDDRFGTTQADILAQFMCPVGFKYPEGAVADSAELYIYYSTWFGNGNAPMQINVYEMDKSTFDYSTQYRSDLSVTDYWSGSPSTSILKAPRIISAAHHTDSTYSSSTGGYLPYIRFKLSNDFVQRFFNVGENTYRSEEDFIKFFKGLYITSDFGSSCMLNITHINMALFYKFSYNKAGRDTTVNDIKYFYANNEVRQVNRISHFNKNTDYELQDTLNYVVSPANMMTRITLPMKRMSETIRSKTAGKRPYMNSTLIKVDVTDVKASNLAQPSKYMLLIKESALNRFFDNKELPVDSCAVIAKIDSTTTSGVVSYYYGYDLSTILTTELRKEQAAVEQEMNLLLVPVSVETTTSSNTQYISAVKHQQSITATTLRGGKHTKTPLKVSLIYTGL